MKNRKLHLFLISAINTIFLFLLVNNEKLVLPYVKKFYDIKTYQEVMQNHVLVYIIFLIMGVLQPMIVIFLSAVLSWIIAMLIFEDDDFSRILYLATKTYWIAVFFSGLKLLFSFCFGKIFSISLAFITKNQILHSLLEIVSLDMLIYIVILSFGIASLYENKNRRKVFMVINSLFYIAISFLIKIMPMAM
ncbi:MAG: hypothetical protein LBI41_00195 [Lactobacillales bacterium]|nr:hypothetical protein [Lactobacillales bacterium]